MASWADKISNGYLNPYIKQIDQDTYLRTGLMLQEKYDQGVAAVQSDIDHVAGLPVATEADRNYLQNLMGNLQQEIQGVASADFSSQALQHQVGAMAGKIARDPVIQNSVLSAQRINQLKQSFQELKKSHPEQYSQSNEQWVDENFLSPFYAQGKTQTGLIYSGPTDAIPYTNYRKIFDEELQKVEPSIQTSITPNGEFQYKVDKSSTITPGKIQGVINSVLSSRPDIAQQMQIDGYFTYKNFTPKALFNHVQDTYNDKITSYKNIDKEIRYRMSAHPNDYNLITEGNSKLMDINNTLESLANQRNRYLTALNEGNVDLVKQSLFNDTLREGYALKYTKDNHDIDYKTDQAQVDSYNIALKKDENWLRFIEAGVDPATHSAITPSNPLYGVFLAAHRKKDGEEPSSPIQSVAVPGQSATDYTIDDHVAKIKMLDNNIDSRIEALKKNYANVNGINYDPTSKDLQQGFENYMAANSKKYAEGDPTVDGNFAQYMSLTSNDRSLRKNLQDESKRIGETAVKKFFDFGTNQLFKNVTIYEPNGTTRKNDVVVGNPLLIEKALEVRAFANDIFRESHPIVMGALTSDIGNKEYQQAAEKYKNDPDYKYILSLAQDDQIVKYLRKAQDNMGQFSAYTNAEFAKMGRTASFQAIPFAEGDTKKNEVKPLIAQAVFDQTKKGVSVDEIKPISYFNNVDGTLSINYQVGKHEKIETVQVPADKNVMGNPNPYFKIKQAIDISTNKSTPRDPLNCLSTFNGKIKYAIAENPLDGRYQVSILHGGKWFSLPTADVNNPANAFSSTDIGTIINSMEEISKVSKERFEQLLQQQFSPK